MSAMNLVITNNGSAAYLLVDTAASKGDRKLFGHNAKVKTYPHARAALAGRGDVHLLSMVERHFQYCTDFDQMADTLQQRCTNTPGFKAIRVISALFKIAARPGVSTKKIPHRNEVELLLCGWSERNKRMMAVTASSFVVGNREPFEPYYAQVFLAPSLPNELGQLLLQHAESQRSQMGYSGFLLNAMKEQRERAAAANAEVIGGMAVLTCVTRNNISQRVLHTWPDEVGKQVA